MTLAYFERRLLAHGYLDLVTSTQNCYSFLLHAHASLEISRLQEIDDEDRPNFRLAFALAPHWTSGGAGGDVGRGAECALGERRQYF